MRTLHCLLFAAALAALGPAMEGRAQVSRAEPAPGGPESVDPGDNKAVAPETANKVRRFLDRFVDPHKSGVEMASMFADDADYYERGAVGRAEIERDVERYNRHWPYRSFRVSRISYMKADPQSDGVFVAYTIDFEVANSARSIAGQANYAALIGNLDGAPMVMAIKEKVTRRSASRTQPPSVAQPGVNVDNEGATSGPSGVEFDDSGVVPWPLRE